MPIECPIMETQEYKDLYEQAKLAYPNEFEYLLQIACISHLMDENLKCNIIIDNEIQKEHNCE